MTGLKAIRKQRVTHNGTLSSWRDAISGMPQKSILGFILFAIYIKTFVEVVKYSDLFLVTDDNKLFKYYETNKILHCYSMILMVCLTGH